MRRAANIVLSWALLLAGVVGLLAGGRRAIADTLGATVDAKVVSIRTNAPGRRWYDIRLVTKSAGSV